MNLFHKWAYYIKNCLLLCDSVFKSLPHWWVLPLFKKKWQNFSLLINLRLTQNLHHLNCFRTFIRRPVLILSSVITSWWIIILGTKSALLSRLMKKSLSGDIIRTQKLSFIIRTAGRHFPGHLLAWDFVKENWNKLVQK